MSEAERGMFEEQHFKDHQKEAKIFRWRVAAMASIMLLLFAVLIGRYYHLQVVDYEEYATLSEHNRVHVEPIPPTRGIIYDSTGDVLADNHASFTLSLVVNKGMDVDSTINILRTLVEITPADLDKFYKLKKQQIHPLEPIPLRYRLTEEEIARLAVNEYRLDGVQVDAELVRYYPYAELFAHSVGYVSRISENDLEKFTEDQVRKYSGTHSIGKTGVEASYEDVLLGEVGSQNVETNARGRIQRVLDRIVPNPGQNVTLHLDRRLQETAEAALAGRRGSVVAIDVKTGGVLVALSNPGYDPNLFVTGIGFKDYKALNEAEDTPLVNRFMQGTYPPGSTVKPLVGLAGLHHGFVDENRGVSDPGFFTLAGTSRQWKDWKKGGHGGHVALKQAVAESCDTYFYDLGVRMGVDKLSEFGNHFGLGVKTNIDLPSEKKAVWPSREWKKAVKKEAWYPGDSVNMGIGQGFVSLTPLQLAVMTATIANKGVRMRPQMAKMIGNTPVAPVVEDKIEVSQKNWDLIFDAMAEVMRPGSRGTGAALSKGADYVMAGKSGSAQVITYIANQRYSVSDLLKMKENQRDHALFVAFAPLEDPQIAIAVLVENTATHGGSTAGPIARYVFDGYLRGKYYKPGDTLPAIGASPAAPVPVNDPNAATEASDEQEDHHENTEPEPYDRPNQ